MIYITECVIFTIGIEVRRAIVKQFSARTAVGSRGKHTQSTGSDQTKQHSTIDLISEKSILYTVWFDVVETITNYRH